MFERDASLILSDARFLTEGMFCIAPTIITCNCNGDMLHCPCNCNGDMLHCPCNCNGDMLHCSCNLLGDEDPFDDDGVEVDESLFQDLGDLDIDS